MTASAQPVVHHAWQPEPEGTGRAFVVAQKYVRPQYGSGEVNAAGKKLRNYFIDDDDETTNHALEVINNWRACHSYPLLTMRMTLYKRARSVDSKAIVAQRLKRLWSIALKLERNENMALSQM
jgi:hypothetical protein